MLGARIKERCQALKITTSDLWRKSGISKAYISQMIAGKSISPSYRVIRALAVVLETSSAYLMGDTDSKDAQSCETCKFVDTSLHKMPRESNPVYGICRRYPPSAENGREFPIVKLDKWCGEYKAE